jgi:hypothetical protein
VDGFTSTDPLRYLTQEPDVALGVVRIDVGPQHLTGVVTICQLEIHHTVAQIVELDPTKLARSSRNIFIESLDGLDGGLLVDTYYHSTVVGPKNQQVEHVFGSTRELFLVSTSVQPALSVGDVQVEVA